MKLFLWVVVFAYSLIGSANAALIDITAISNDVRLSDFTIRFDDLSGDGLLQVDEILQFSGMTMTGFGTNFDGLYDVIIGARDINGISTLSGTVVGISGPNWNMIQSASGIGGGCCAALYWSYSSALATVPIPQQRGSLVRVYLV